MLVNNFDSTFIINNHANKKQDKAALLASLVNAAQEILT